jgi:transposase InsO family protein
VVVGHHEAPRTRARELVPLYVVLDIFSRHVVAWTVQAVEDSQIAKTMPEEAMDVHGITGAIHADGAPR